ncbi:hypothetical protein P6281_17165 [Mycobacterium sp. 5-140-3-2]|uniref:hypothetical protein n=1 Tax=Mycobacterium TaxID=1763 RepID=UPI00191647F7|nr:MULTISPECIES: hypothetical protein [Mycobacterium]WRU80807.1 hypothetical protein P6281_17165 [Mycobacterium sp. 5-140-3-2]WSE43040.1 hypothetical protein QGN28_08955 [Mycobacterium sp. 5-140-3-1]
MALARDIPVLTHRGAGVLAAQGLLRGVNIRYSVTTHFVEEGARNGDQPVDEPDRATGVVDAVEPQVAFGDRLPGSDCATRLPDCFSLLFIHVGSVA